MVVDRLAEEMAVLGAASYAFVGAVGLLHCYLGNNPDMKDQNLALQLLEAFLHLELTHGHTEEVPLFRMEQVPGQERLHSPHGHMVREQGQKEPCPFRHLRSQTVIAWVCSLRT
mmetsp:Transcript_22303/g.37365  ORF Transcript_22303/g.37365 Transcript_22303/m.37365 type:complete len:114 (+) Transcript_22303:1060-1401(+)